MDSIALFLRTVRPMPHLKDILEAKGRWHMRQTPPLQYLQGSQNKLSHCIMCFVQQQPQYLSVAAALQNT